MVTLSSGYFLYVSGLEGRIIPTRIPHKFKMNNNPGAVIAVKEERVIIGGVEMTKKTAIAATEQG